ncbi:hypothetical protein CLOM_g18467 [Closterium sp. NIES-68]|nr:hypothetical protein CLOM_g18467 [Closterium sp. NIES-68]GJP69527.1 hypothetical protein CLOP_g531 [Closterium sp. NIES-67]
MAPSLSFLSCVAAVQFFLILLDVSVSVHARSFPSGDFPRDLHVDADSRQSASSSQIEFQTAARDLTATRGVIRPIEEPDAAKFRQSESSGAALRLALRGHLKRLATFWASAFRKQRLHESEPGFRHQNDNAGARVRNTEGGNGNSIVYTSLSQLFPLRAVASRKQVLGGSGATFFEQDANGGSINNLGVTNSQRSRVGDGMGYASSFQGNSMSQTSATNPTLPTVYGGSSVYTTAATNGVGSSFPFAGLGTTGDVFVGVDGQLIPTGASIGD